MADPDAAYRRRRQVARWIHNLWTESGSDDAGIVEPWLDGRLRLLGVYVTLGDLPPSAQVGSEDQQDDGGSGCDSDRADPPNVSVSHPYPPFTVDRVHCKDLSYDDFVCRYMQPNLPVIIQGLAEDWRATREWTMDNSDEAAVGARAEQPLSPNVQYLSANFGQDAVKVMEQPHPGLGPMRPIERETTIAEFARYWEGHHSADPGDEEHASILYLKDYKFVANHPNYRAYEWPHFFRDDWLNDAVGHAYKFVYLGPKSSSTVLHADVLRSYSWSTNVCGRKRWFLVPPTATSCLYDCFGSRLATHLRADVGEMGHIFPGLELARSVAVEIIQEAGETIFVPSNVFHTVENLEPTLSINHNWINRHNVLHCWEHVRAQVDAAREAQRRAASGGECAQGMDDLNLLWHVVSDRSERVLRHLETEVTTELPSMLLARDAKASLLVLNGMLKMLSENQCSKDVLDSGPVFLLSKRLQSVLSCNRNPNTAG